MAEVDTEIALSLLVLAIQIYNQYVAASIKTEILELKVLIYRDFELKDKK